MGAFHNNYVFVVFWYTATATTTTTPIINAGVYPPGLCVYSTASMHVYFVLFLRFSALQQTRLYYF